MGCSVFSFFRWFSNSVCDGLDSGLVVVFFLFLVEYIAGKLVLGAYVSFGIREAIFVSLVDEVSNASTKAISDSNLFCNNFKVS